MGIETELKSYFDEVGKRWDEYKSTNDERLEAKADAKAVSELDAKLAKMDEEFKESKKAMEEEIAKSKRLGLGGQNEGELEKSLEKSAFQKIIRHGNASRMTEEEMKSFVTGQTKMWRGSRTESDIKSAMISGSDPDGGYFVLPELANEITRLVKDEVALARVAQTVTTGTSLYNKRVQLSGATFTWEGEQTHPSTTDTPTYGVLGFPVHTLAANPSISQELLQDADVNVETELTDSLREAFAQGMADAFVNGSDTKMPRGLLSYPTVANSSYKWGNIGFTKTGVAGGFATPSSTASPADCLIDLIHALPRQYRGNGRWMMNDLTTASLRKMKNTDGEYIWQPGLISSAPDMLLGYPVETDEKFPDVAANAFPIAFGDFFKAYLVVMRSGMTFIRDPYTQKPFVVFSTRMRVGGGVQNFEAVKLLKVAA